MNVRPTGISIIAIAMIILGIYSFIWAMLAFGVGGLSTIFGSIFTLSPQVSSNLWSGFVGMAAGLVQLATGIGLLGMKSWSWYLAFIGVGLSIIQGLMGLFSGSFLCSAIGMIIPVIIAIYLLKPEIRELFGIGDSGKSV